MDITVETTQDLNGFPAIHLFQDNQKLCKLDIDFSKLQRFKPHSENAVDFLLFAATVYACDKLFSRRTSEEVSDAWTRDFKILLPVRTPAVWAAAREKIEHCLSFLTGDIWTIENKERVGDLLQNNGVQTPLEAPPETVSLFSGGIDSLIGAIDWLHDNQGKKLLLMGCYDKDVPGPKTDQENLAPELSENYPDRVDHICVRVTPKQLAKEHTYRSRSLLFLALGMYAANSLSPDTPLLMPENGTIALNVPLTPSRRGSCSTRTSHPDFLCQLRMIFSMLGIENAIENPLCNKTKGEVVSACKNQALIGQIANLSVSCAKRGHRAHWKNKGAKGCGYCMPCIYRRAALHKINIDNEMYGFDICKGEIDLDRTDSSVPRDLRACLSFISKNYSTHEIQRMLIASGHLEISKLELYAQLVVRAMNEIKDLLRAKATQAVQERAGF